MTPADVTDDLAAAYARAQAELTRLSVVNAELRSRVEELETGTLAADLEALRAKAEALADSYKEMSFDNEDWRQNVRGHEDLEAAYLLVRAELDKPSGASLLAERDAWEALAKARAEILGRPDAWADEEIRGRLLAAKAALRALGVDPEAK